MCVGCWQYLKPRIEGRCLAWLFLSQHMLPLKAANVLQKRSNPWWENKGDVWGGWARRKKKKTKKYPIFRRGLTLVKISGLILLNWVFPLFTGFNEDKLLIEWWRTEWNRAQRASLNVTRQKLFLPIPNTKTAVYSPCKSDYTQARAVMCLHFATQNSLWLSRNISKRGFMQPRG